MENIKKFNVEEAQLIKKFKKLWRQEFKYVALDMEVEEILNVISTTSSLLSAVDVCSCLHADRIMQKHANIILNKKHKFKK